MTNVNSAAPPPARPALEVPADPPTMKNAGRLSPEYGGMDVVSVMLIASMFVILVGSMILAIWTSHRRGVQGVTGYAVAGLAALALTVLAVALQDTGFGFAEEVLMFAAPLGLAWLSLGAIAFLVGSIVRPGRHGPDLSTF